MRNAEIKLARWWTGNRSGAGKRKALPLGRGVETRGISRRTAGWLRMSLAPNQMCSRATNARAEEASARFAAAWGSCSRAQGERALKDTLAKTVDALGTIWGRRTSRNEPACWTARRLGGGRELS